MSRQPLPEDEPKCPYCQFTSGIDVVMKGHIKRAHGSEGVSPHLNGEAFTNLDEAMVALSLPPSVYTLDEGQRQAILLALGHLAVERPGWDYMLGEIADQFQGREMFERFKTGKKAGQS
jgi:hypothetical protein